MESLPSSPLYARPRRRRLAQAACALVLLSLAGIAAAQVRAVQGVAPRPAPAGASTFGLPNPAGLSSPSAFPGGLPPVAVPSSANTSGAAGLGIGETRPGAGVVGVGAGGTAAGVSGTTPAPALDAGGSAGNPTAVLGAGAGAIGVRPQPQSTPFGAGPFSVVDVARSFLGADANADGDLSRGEFQRLTIRPLGFEEMDRNFDGRITRSEYEDALR